MRLACLLFVGLAFAIFITEVSANCLCGATGQDYCSCKKFIPFPKPNKYPGLPPALQPIGDRCGCDKQFVEPAIPPRPCCPKKLLPHSFVKPVCSKCGGGIGAASSFHLGSVSSSSSSSCSCHKHDVSVSSCSSQSHAHDDLSLSHHYQYKPHTTKHYGLPADPVSVSLAYQMGKCKEFSIPEAKLQYGFQQPPINVYKTSWVGRIPEEKLYGLNREIIELKKKAEKRKEEEIIEEESEEDVRHDAAHLTYGELGYCAEKFASAKFVSVPAPNHELPCSANPPEPIGNCGFQPGRIVPYNTVERRFNYGTCLEG